MKDDSSNWKFLIFYFNREDSRVFVPKRIGIGWTLNFARWQSYLFILAIIAAVVISIINAL